MKDWTGNYQSVVGCLGTRNGSTKDREENDYYATDPIAAEWLMKLENLDNNIWECNTSGEECKYINSSYRNNFIFSVDQQVNSNQEYKMRLNLKEKDDDIDVRATWSNPAIWIPSHLRKLKISGKFYLNTTNTNDVKEIKIYANDGSADTLIGCQKVLLVNSGYNMLEL